MSDTKRDRPALEGSPKQIALPESVIKNAYGNVSEPPSGWAEMGECRKQWAKDAAAKGAAVQVVTGWGGSRKWPRPILKWYIHPEWMPAPQDEQRTIVDPKHSEAATKAAETRRLRRAEKENANFAAVMDRRHITSPELRDVLTKADRYWATEAIQTLNNVNEANPSWLREMLSAVEDNDGRGGIMRAYRLHGIDYDMDFYDSARKATAASHRHELTDYDSISKRGMGQDEVDWLSHQKTGEARKAVAREEEFGGIPCINDAGELGDQMIADINVALREKQ